MSDAPAEQTLFSQLAEATAEVKSLDGPTGPPTGARQLDPSTPADDAQRSSIGLARRLDGLHQLLYTRGGIRPSNAAVEELTKLLLLRIAATRHPRTRVEGFGELHRVLQPERLAAADGPAAAKAAFIVANRLRSLSARLPNGDRQPVWPLDEPLRISRADVLAEAVDILGEVELGGVGSYDPVGAAFDVFLRGRYEHAGGLGTYLTPEGVVDLMVRVGFDLMERAAGDVSLGKVLLGDPCCGSGRFLIGMLHEARRRGYEELSLEAGDWLFGADQSASSVAMARVNLMAAGIKTPEVFVVEDSITDEWVSRATERFSLILTNPPFGDNKYDSALGIDKTGRILPRLAKASRIDPSHAFVARCVELLAPNGVVGIILPDGVGDGPAMRDLLMGYAESDPRVRLEGVVSLPSVTFAPAGTTAKTSVTFFRKAVGDRRTTVFLARADHVGYMMSKGSAATDPEGDDLPAITAVIRSYISGDDLLADEQHVATPHLRDIASLDASSFSRSSEDARAALIERGGIEAGTFLESCGKRRRPVSRDVPFVSVLHVDELGAIDWNQADELRPTTPGQLARPGELLVSLLNPSKFRAAVVPADAGDVHCSAEFGVFESKIDPYVALALLQHPLVRTQIAPLGRGTSSSRRRIDPADVQSLIVPPYDAGWAEKVAAIGRSSFEQITDARQRLRDIYEGPS